MRSSLREAPSRVGTRHLAGILTLLTITITAPALAASQFQALATAGFRSSTASCGSTSTPVPTTIRGCGVR